MARMNPSGAGRGSSWSRRTLIALAAVLMSVTILGAGRFAALQLKETDGATTVAPKARPSDSQAPSEPDPSLTQEPQPNIAMVMVDDMRWDEMVWMPNVRRYLGKQGLNFRNSFSPYPLCCPARASFLSGQYAHNHRVLSHNAPYGFASYDDTRSLATALQDVGYRTSFVGKYLNGYGLQKTPSGAGKSASYIPPGWSSWQSAVELKVPRSDPLFGGTYFYFDTTMNLDGTVTAMPGRYSTEVFGELAREQVTQSGSKPEPWFMYLSLVAPHHGAPKEPDDPAFRWLKRGDDPLPGDYFTPARPNWIKGAVDDRITKGLGIPLPGQPEEETGSKPDYLSTWPPLDDVDRESIRTISRQRAEALIIADDEFGELMKTLEQTDQLKDTVVIFTSDNGYFLGEQRQREGKIKPHEPSLRVPLLMRVPGALPGLRDDPTRTMDVTATILDYAGAVPPAEPDGLSLRGVIEGGDDGWDTPIVTESIILRVPPSKRNKGWTDLSSIGLRLAGWSYTLYSTGEVEIYDMLADPEQLRNLRDRPRILETQRALAKLLQERFTCAATECYSPVPVNLQLTSAANSAQTSASIAAHEQRFGRLRPLSRQQAAAIMSSRPADGSTTP